MKNLEIQQRFERLKELLTLASQTQRIAPDYTSMTERYYSIQREFNKVRNLLNELPSETYVPNDFKTPVIIGYNTTTWTKSDNRQSKQILKNILSRPKR